MHRSQNRALKIYFFVSLVLVLCFSQTGRICAQTAGTYEEAIRKGNAELKSNKLLDAKAYFLMALRLKPGDPTAQKLMEETVRLIQKKDNRQQGYYNLIDQADDALAKGDLELAKTTYEKALKSDPGDAYALGKIKEVNGKEIEEKQKQALFLSEMDQGVRLLGIQEFDSAVNRFEAAQKIFPNRKMVAEKIALAQKLKKEFRHRQELAQEEIKTAQRYLLIRNYSDALSRLQKADSLTPGNAQLIAKINQIEPLALKQKAYNEKAGEADKLYIAKNYMAAKVKYQEALSLWPDNPYPQYMINRIDATLQDKKAHLEENYQTAIHQADSLFRIAEPDNARAEYRLALSLKPKAAYPEAQLKKIEEMIKKEQEIRAAQYRKILHQGDSLLNHKQYLASREVFAGALALNPTDPYPKEKLKEISKALVQQAAEQKTEAQYQEFITSGDHLFTTHTWDLSLQKYQMALQLKPGAAYPKTKIASIEKILADSVQLRKVEEQFTLQMQQGKRLQAAKRWQEAKRAYLKAQTLKPGAVAAQQAIAEVDSILQQIAVQKKNDMAFNTAFHEGNSLLARKSYQLALEAFQKAEDLKPSETAVKEKIDRIRQILAARAHQEQVNLQFADTLRQADSLLKRKSYELALGKYQAAAALKPAETYPPTKIKEIDTLLRRLEKERQQRYDQTVATADSSFRTKDYQAALQQYKTASSILPAENYPKQQLLLCQQLLAASYQKNKAQYDQEITLADKFYQSKSFDRAIEIYKIAHHILPEETYPMQMVRKITKYISDNAIEDIVKENVGLQPNETKKFPFKPIPVKVRQSNFVLVKATNLSGNSFNLIFNFGQGKSKNGGFVVRVPEGKGEYSFIINIGSQYKWFSDDNDWLSVFSENNPLEVNLIRISKTE